MTSETTLMSAAQEAMRIAVDIFRSRPPGHLTEKGDRDTASEVDYAIEDQVRSLLQSRTPQVGFMGEERGASGDSLEEWVLDPVDGTSNFVHGIPVCGVSLALLREKVPVLGLVSLPMLNLLYRAESGGGAYCNDERIYASGATQLGGAVVSIGDYAVGEGSEQKNIARIALTAKIASKAERVRMLGSAATDLVWVAHGRLDATVILSNKPWDMSAGVLIAREAGAVTTDRHGSPHSLDSLSTVAVAPGIRQPLIDLLEEE